MSAESTFREYLLSVALGAARAGAAVAMKHYRSGVRVPYEAKARNDFVTAVDREAEAAIVAEIRERFPRHAILAEESERTTSGEEIRWIIDPLDGTTNFIHGFPVFSVSVAAAEIGPSGPGSTLASRPGSHSHRAVSEEKHEASRGGDEKPRAAPDEGHGSSEIRLSLDPSDLVVGVVIDPVREEVFTAARGGGARLNGRPVRVSEARELDSSLLATGFPFRAQDLLPAYLRIFEDFHKATQGIRRPGSAALDLSYVASGRVDGFFEFGLSPWDIAAGALMVQEAGGTVAGFTGVDDYLATGHVVAGAPPITSAMLNVIAKHYP